MQLIILVFIVPIFMIAVGGSLLLPFVLWDVMSA